MAGWKDILFDVLRLTDETKRLNKDIDQMQSLLTDIDRRLVRVETVIDIAALQGKGGGRLPEQ